ncbi:unnamed protein product [Euphydryas editha]|uniref:Uncharacterized protein n=1 Tax=Euphydryas editha TaxID=104508 RepID=A0AAU9TPN1_EUPED|nr:unnamed protein product [Euphydryas editha]
MKTLIEESAEKGDEFTDYLKSQKSVAVHVQCQKKYTRRSTIAAVKRQHEEDPASTSKISPPHTRTRVCESDFCFKKLLFLAMKQIKNMKRKELRKGLFQINMEPGLGNACHVPGADPVPQQSVPPVRPLGRVAGAACKEAPRAESTAHTYATHDYVFQQHS